MGLGSAAQIQIREVFNLNLKHFLLLTGTLAVTSAHAVLLTPDGAVLTNGTTDAARPELGGTIIADELRPFVGQDFFGNTIFTGTVQTRVVRSDVDSTLIFYYRVLNDATSSTSITSISARNFAGYTTDVDYRTDSLGSIGSTLATRDASGSNVNFQFIPSPIGNGEISPGNSSYFFFIKTDATEYGIGTVSLLNGGVANVQGFAPVPEPGILFALAGAGLLISSRRKVR